MCAGPPFIPVRPPAPSVSPSLAPSSSSLGHWGEWAAILILISLSLCGPLAERGEWSPGFWNAPPLSSGHWVRVKGERDREEARERERDRKKERKRVNRGREIIVDGKSREHAGENDEERWRDSYSDSVSDSDSDGELSVVN